VKINKSVIPFIFLIVIFFVGITIGIIIRDFPYLTLKKEISLGEVSSFILALFVAIYVPFILDKKINGKRIEKEILLNECKDLSKEIHELRLLVESSHLKFKNIPKFNAEQIISRVRNIGNMLKLLIDDFFPYKEDKEIISILNTLKSNQYLYWENLTDHLRDRRRYISIDVFNKAQIDIYEYLGNISKLRMHLNDV
jgi:hypothetical protein